MASRVHLPQLPRVSNPVDRERIDRAWTSLRSWRPPTGDALKLAAYQALWLPFWLSSDMPAPVFRERDQPLPAGGPAGDHVANVMTHLQRRLWMQRALSVFFRAAWLPLLIGVVWLIVELQGGPALRARALLWIGIGLLVPAAVFSYLVKPSRRQIARMLDRSFGLQDRLQTALENVGNLVPADGEKARVTYLQMADAANVMTDLRSHPAFKVRPPIREVVLAIACALVLGALFFVRGVGGSIPPVSESAVPAFVPAADRLAAEEEPQPETESAAADAPTRQEVQERAEKSNQAQQDLKKLGDALADQAVTRSVSEAIERGDYDAAADQLRDTAANADQWSQAAREALADELDQAADQMSESDGQLAESARDAADGLREGGQAAKDGVSKLGDAVDQTSSDIVSQRELADQMRQASEADAQRGDSGQSGEPDEGAPPEAGQPEDGSGEPGDSGSEAGEGAGADAQPGEATEGEQSNEPGQSGDGGTGEQQSGSEPGGTGEEGQSQEGNQGAGEPGEGQQSGGGSQAGVAPESEGDPGNQEGESGEGGDAGAGAGSGNADGTQGAEDGQSSGNQPAEGEASDPNVSNAGPAEGEGTEAKDPRSAITLSRAPNAEGVQTSGNNGASSVGSGSGASVAGGDSVQGDVGATGPDSNRVPPAYRGVVEDYFSDPDGS